MSALVSARKSTACHLVGALIACAVGIEGVSAQTAPPAGRPEAAVPARVPMPDNAKITLLIQIHMAALSQAILTGNYTVLRALGSPMFQAANSTDQLAAKFSSFHGQGIDISPTILFSPMLYGPPKLEGADFLRVSGQYNTTPQRVVFQMAFQAVNNAWRLAGITVSTVAADQAQQGGDQPAAPAPAAKAANSGDPAKK
jgi:hypothetical protein